MTVFLDTDVLAYRFDDRDPAKRDRAAAIPDELTSRPWISSQVLTEDFTNGATLRGAHRQSVRLGMRR